MPLEVRSFRCLQSNYGLLVRDTATGVAAAVDAPDADAVLADAKAAGWTLSYVLSVMLGDTRFDVIETGGHTLGHVSLHAPEADVVFTGDSLFPLGCGRMFEGTPAQTWAGLQRLAALPPRTVVWAAHEYGADNARYALSVEFDEATRAAAQAVLERCGRGEPSVPTTIGAERAANPFVNAPGLHPDASPEAAFAAVRAAKDAFKG